MMKIAVISNHSLSLVNFRGPLITSMIKNKMHVSALAPDYDEYTMGEVRALGADPVHYSLSRTGMNPIRDLIDLYKLYILLCRLKPDVTLAYFVKPVIYGSIAAWLAGVERRYSMIEGLGFIFIEDNTETIKHKLLKKMISNMYRLSLSLNRNVIFLNHDDLEEFSKGGIISDGRAVLISGIGVDLKSFYFAPPIQKPVTFLFIGRMLKEKGVYEFIEAARYLKNHYPETRVIFVGNVDDNPSSIPEYELRKWVEECLIEWPGQVKDVRPWIERSSVFVLPSYYREGKPRTIQEAMAMGRPVITTNAPGCRETVHDGVNGFLIPVHDCDALARSMERFIEDPDLIVTMGLESRRLAETHYDVHKINRQLMSIMGISDV